MKKTKETSAWTFSLVGIGTVIFFTALCLTLGELLAPKVVLLTCIFFMAFPFLALYVTNWGCAGTVTYEVEIREGLSGYRTINYPSRPRFAAVCWGMIATAFLVLLLGDYMFSKLRLPW
ncbi:hypothetical protein C4587_02755 [Candidatus Parcubacteria bacterium]|nr:MAG: hypothetical protein C4587_02755 [Candidatus Parcubacteria bacterium]